MRLRLLALLALPTLPAAHAGAQAQTYPPIERYLMPQDAEIALARTAAPPNVSDRATIKVLTKSGFTVARQGDNGNVCMVMRGFSAPTYTPAQFRDREGSRIATPPPSPTCGPRISIWAPASTHGIRT